MNILKKADFCPLCGNKINLITNPKCKLKDGNFVCKKCVIELVGLWKKDQEELLELNITQIKEKYKNRGLDVFSPAEKIGTSTMFMAFDDANRMFSFSQSLLSAEQKRSYDELASYEVIVNDHTKTKSGLGKALIGGAIAGPAGMITGAIIGKGQTGADVIQSLAFVIVLKDGQRFALPFISKDTNANSLAAQSTWTTIVRLIDKLDEILQQPSVAQEVEADRGVVSNYEELIKMKELLELDIITQEEFDIKKKELLNL